jgi:predicted enzyme related to lactoylglutathione lyase
MGQPVVHFEIIGSDAAGLRDYYGELFNWQFDTDSPVAAEVSDEGNYGFVQPMPADAVGQIPGGVGGGPGFAPHAVFYVGVPNVEAALQKAEALGGKRVMGPARNPNGQLVVAHFTDPEGTLVGLAGPN